MFSNDANALSLSLSLSLSLTSDLRSCPLSPSPSPSPSPGSPSARRPSTAAPGGRCWTLDIALALALSRAFRLRFCSALLWPSLLAGLPLSMAEHGPAFSSLAALAAPPPLSLRLAGEGHLNKRKRSMAEGERAPPSSSSSSASLLGRADLVGRTPPPAALPPPARCGRPRRLPRCAAAGPRRRGRGALQRGWEEDERRDRAG